MTENKKRINWKDMTENERLNEMRQIAKEKCIVDGAIALYKSKKLAHAMRIYKVSATNLIEGTGLKIKFNHKDFKSELSIEIKRLFDINIFLKEKVLNDLADANTLGELIATTVYNKNGTVKKEVLRLFSAQLKATDVVNKVSGLLDFADEPLNGLTKKKYKEILHFLAKKLSIPVSSDAIMNRRMAKLLFKNAAESGLFIPAGLECDIPSCASKFIEAERKRIKKPITVYEHCIGVFPDGKLAQKAKVIIALKETASVKPEHYGLVLTRKFLGNESKAVRSIIIRGIYKMLDSLQNAGIKFGVPLSDSIRESAIELPYLQNLLTKDNVAKKDRTFGWYVFEVFSTYKQWEKRHFKQYVYSAYKDYFGTKLIEMTKENFLEIKSETNAPRFMDIVRRIHTEGMCSKDILSNLQETEGDMLDFNATVWKLNGGFLDFDLIDEIYRDAIRHYVKYFQENKKNVPPYKIYTMLEFFKLSNMPKLSTLTHNSEMIFYTTLQKSIIDVASQCKARISLKQFRSVVNNLAKLSLALVPRNYKLNYDFTIKEVKSKIITFNENEQQAIVDFLQRPPSKTDKYMDRLQLCAFGIQMLSARRVSEVVSKKKDWGLKIDAIHNWGMSGEKEFRYFRSKVPSGKQVVLFGDMIGERTDPFAKAIPSLIPKLFEEAIEITSAYRHSLSVDLKDYLFVVKTNGSGGTTILYDKMGGIFMHKKVKKLFKDIGVDTSKTPHTARHTQATSLILAGGTVADAADALGDKTKTISIYYHEYTSRQDSLRLLANQGRTQMADSLEDSAQFKKIEEDQHKVCVPEEMSPHGYKMAGGSCTHTTEGRLNCKSYQMMRGAKSCPGCEFCEISTVDNKAYWEAELKATLQNMESTDPSSPAFLYEELNHQVAENMLKEIEVKELEAEWGF